MVNPRPVSSHMWKTTREVARLQLCLALGMVLGWSSVIAAQTQPAPPAQVPPGTIAATVETVPPGDASTLTFFNRPIVVFRARVLGRSPAERAAGAVRILDDLAAQRITGPVEAQAFEGGIAHQRRIAGRPGADSSRRRRTRRRNDAGGQRPDRRAPAAGARRGGRSAHARAR